MAATTHVMVPRPPIRALAVAAALVVGGGALAVVADLWGWSIIVMAVGFVLIVLGLALTGVAFVSTRARRVRVILDDDGFRVEGPGPLREGTWLEITRVTRTGDRITLYQGGEKRIHLVLPEGGSADLDALGTDITRRLDASRGYRPQLGQQPIVP